MKGKTPPTVHGLKIWPTHFEKLKTGEKNFEVRLNDRNFHVNDEIVFREFIPKGYFSDGDPERGFTGQLCHKQISFILANFYAVSNEYVVLALVEPGNTQYPL